MGILDDLDDVGRDHLNDLTDQVKRGQCVLFLGAGVSNEVGLPSGWELTSLLAKEAGIPPTTLSQVAQAYKTKFNRARLIQRLKQLIEECPVLSHGVTSCDLLTEIKPIRMIFTTNWDDQIERAFHRKSILINPVRYSNQISLIDKDVVTVVKLHGDFGSDSLVLTRDDYLNAYNEVTKPGGLFTLLANSLGTTTILFVGYSLEDDDFRTLYDFVQKAMGSGVRRHYAVMDRASQLAKKEWGDRNIVIIESKAHNLFEHVAHQVRDFVNREEERESVFGLRSKPFTEFCGVAGSGKTKLLREVEDHYRLGKAWFHAYVGFDERPLFTILDWAVDISRQTLGYTLNKDDLVARARDEFKLGSLSTEQVISKAEQLAAKDLGKLWATKRVALLFDASEQIADTFKRWIEKELVPVLQNGSLDLKSQLRMVFAGRKPIAWETPALKQNLNRIALSPFDETTIGEMLDWFAALKVSDPLPQNKRHQILLDTLAISGGHPGCIKKIFEKLAELDFEVPSDYISTHEKTIFEEIVLPIFQGEILQKVPAEIRSALELVSIFRRLSPDFLDVLIERGYLENKYGTGLALLGHLCGTYLVLLPRPPAQLYDVDPLVRQIFSSRMRIFETKRFRKLNSMAVEVYDKAIMGQTLSGDLLPYPPSNDLRITYIIEIMYHFVVHAIANNMPIKKVRSGIKEKIGKYLEILKANVSSNELKRLFDILEARFGEDPEQADHELLALAAKLIPDDGYHMFLEPIKEFRKRWLP